MRTRFLAAAGAGARLISTMRGDPVSAVGGASRSGSAAGAAAGVAKKERSVAPAGQPARETACEATTSGSGRRGGVALRGVLFGGAGIDREAAVFSVDSRAGESASGRTELGGASDEAEAVERAGETLRLGLAEADACLRAAVGASRTKGGTTRLPPKKGRDYSCEASWPRAEVECVR